MYCPSKDENKLEVEKAQKSRLLATLKLVNGQAKCPLRFVQKKSNLDTNVLTLLNFLSEQAGSLRSFLLHWYNSSYSEQLESFINDCSENEKVALVEQTEKALLKQQQEILNKASIYLLTELPDPLTVRQCYEIASILKRNSKKEKFTVGTGATKHFVPCLIPQARAKKMANSTEAYSSPTELAKKLLEGKKVKVKMDFLKVELDGNLRSTITTLSKEEERAKMAEFRDEKRKRVEELLQGKKLPKPVHIPHYNLTCLLLKTLILWYLEGYTNFDLLEGEVLLYLLKGLDGTKKPGVGFVLPTQFQILWDETLFKKDHEMTVTKPISFIVGNLTENCVNSTMLEAVTARDFSELISTQFTFVNKNGKTVTLIFKFGGCPSRHVPASQELQQRRCQLQPFLHQVLQVPALFPASQ